jgi:type II secretory pathway component PulF
LEREAELASRIRQALAYPAILLVAGTLSVGVITIVVVPRFATILADLGQELPPATRLLLAIAQLVRSYGWILLTMLVIAAAAVLHWVRTPAGQLSLHRALLAAPVIGKVRHNFAAARLCRALGALLTTGVPVLTALRAASEAAGDDELNERLTRAAARVEEGEGLSSSLRREAVLTPLAQQMVEVGDSSGRLGQMALRAGDLAASDAESSLRTLVSILEPALVIGFGSLVAFTAAALLQAVYSLRPG